MSLRNVIMKQFGKPEGFMGRLAGQIMARRLSNIQRNRWAVGLLELKPSDHVLEIGCGPGIALNEFSKMIASGKIIALDHSGLMINSVRKKFGSLEKSGILHTIAEKIEDVQLAPESLNAVFSSNAVQFWNNPVEVFNKIYSALKPGGIVVTNYMERSKNATSRQSLDYISQLSEKATHTKFKISKIESLEMEPVSAYSLILKK
ncbi:MAG: class I SAM-dependent methyltransferase [Spirochaetia bacterium]|nr:class I SAM-dependent methyltransferase [Spirochaetia bacterium]